MSVSYGPYWDIRLDTGDELPFDAPDGSTAMLKDNQSAGVCFFSEEKDCWIDKNGRKWGRGNNKWIP